MTVCYSFCTNKYTSFILFETNIYVISTAHTCRNSITYNCTLRNNENVIRFIVDFLVDISSFSDKYKFIYVCTIFVQ